MKRIVTVFAARHQEAALHHREDGWVCGTAGHPDGDNDQSQAEA